MIILTGDISTETLGEIARHRCAQLNKPVKIEELTGRIRRSSLGRKPAATPGLRPSSAPGNGGPGPVIFVVDDDSDVRRSMDDLLREHGWTVEAYASAEAFLNAYRPGAEGCLLVDAVMPGMSGFALLQRLKDQGSRLPAIMITGNGDVHMAVRAMHAGAVDFLEKPVGNDELLASIDHALGADARFGQAVRVARRGSGAPRRSHRAPAPDTGFGALGHPSKNIAADLGISQRTVENHRNAIMHKTGSKSLPALVRLVLASN